VCGGVSGRGWERGDHYQLLQTRVLFAVFLRLPCGVPLFQVPEGIIRTRVPSGFSKTFKIEK
jgi:hypothetical protein